jgi:hypothetical protein
MGRAATAGCLPSNGLRKIFAPPAEGREAQGRKENPGCRLHSLRRLVGLFS